MIRRLLAFLLGLLAAGALLWRGLPAQDGTAPRVGSPAPAVDLQSLDGRTLHLRAMRGTPVLLNFWATWCAPCRLEMPLLDDRARRWQHDLQVWAINADEPPETVRAFVEEVGMTFPVLLDPGGTVQQRYRIRGYPTTFLVDRDGVIRVQHVGLLSAAQLDAYLKEVGLIP